MREHAEQYAEQGFALCAIKPGTKQPQGNDWQNNPHTPEWWDENPEHGIGVIHSRSGTCTIDIDDIDSARLALEALGVDMDELLEQGVQIQSREGRAKLLYSAPPDLPQKRHNLNWPCQNSKKHFCVIEFRAGDVQDVLPPSIHPDTGEPYQWQGDWRELPDLPHELFCAWREWTLAKQAMEDACPWRKEKQGTPSKAPRKTYTQGEGVIGAFNKAHDVGSILEANEYRKAGGRWRSPHSESGIPGVVLLPESDPQQVYIHHASDPLSDGHAHDAFSLYCQIEHNGDVTAAVKQAAHDMGIEREEDKEGAAIAERMLSGSKKATVTPIPAPQRREPEEETAPDPGSIPCEMGRVVETWLCDQMHSVKPDATRQAVLSYLCHVTARRYTTPDGQPTTTFFAISDSSVAGLRRMKGVLYSLAARMGERKSLRGTGIPSSGVLYAALLRSPRMYWMTDEYGHIVQMARRQQSGALESAIATLHECYTGGTIFIDPDTARTTQKERDLKDCDIYHPGVTLCALLAHDQLSALGQRSEYGRGTLQQTLTITAGDAIDDHVPELGDPPDNLLDWHKKIGSVPGIPGFDQAPTAPPQMTTVHIDANAEPVFSEARKSMQAYMNTDSRQQWRGMVHGYVQSARRVACALAAWEAPESPVVSREVAEWVCQWATRCLMRVIPRMEVTVTDNDEPDVIQRVQQLLFEAGKPLTSREIVKRCRPFRRLSHDDREAILAQMADDGECIAHKTDRTTKYVAPLQQNQ